MRKARTIKEILVATRWIVNRLAWHKGCNWRSRSGKPLIDLKEEIVSSCLYGAMLLVESESHYIFTDAVHYLNAKVPASCGNIAAWNDHSERTKEDIIKFLDKVIKEY